MPRPIKVTLIGAGSVFTPTLVGDLLQIPGEGGGTFALVDVDHDRLATMHRLIERQLETMHKTSRWTVESSPDRADVLGGSDYVVICIEVNGPRAIAFENDIPLKYGVDQCIGDTIGPGGLFKALRTVPSFLAILRDIERLCPRALVMNYTNPMSVLCLAAARASSVPVVGLCHSVQGTSRLLAARAGVPYDELGWECAGINHLAWFTRLEHEHRDLYPRLMAQAERDLAGDPADPKDAGDLIRKDMMLHFGAFITESSGHLSEYLPYYRKRADLRARYCGSDYDGGSRFYADTWPARRLAANETREAMVRGDRPTDRPRTYEYASWIVEAREKDTPLRIHGNVPNHAGDGAGTLITNLPADSCVEVACLVDGNGVRPIRFGRLPAQMAALCDSNLRVFDLAATAALEHRKEAALHALLLDPLTAAVCSPAEIKAMVLELFAAEEALLPGYK
ncbi:MAG: alpha-glucosidase/alpha-galactosidase [Cytophagales bacterium]|nr:alpha-glucosidase/alpha-galactosidase [Armatimonadota bacterium]